MELKKERDRTTPTVVWLLSDSAWAPDSSSSEGNQAKLRNVILFLAHLLLAIICRLIGTLLTAGFYVHSQTKVKAKPLT